MTSPLEQKSRHLTWLLRHGARETGLKMNTAGWVDIHAILKISGLSRTQLRNVVAGDHKQRFQIHADQIRACQGHSTSGTPVTLDALERSWSVWNGHGAIWHGTHLAALTGIAKQGIHAKSRSHVHLSASLHSTVGKRANVAVMLHVDSDRLRHAGQTIFRSPNGVILARFVPMTCITGVEPMTANARRKAKIITTILWPEG